MLFEFCKKLLLLHLPNMEICSNERLFSCPTPLIFFIFWPFFGRFGPYLFAFQFWKKFCCIFLRKNTWFWDFQPFFSGSKARSRQKKVQKSKIWRTELWISIFPRLKPILALDIDLELSLRQFLAIIQKQKLSFLWIFLYKLAKTRA